MNSTRDDGTESLVQNRVQNNTQQRTLKRLRRSL